MAEAFINLTEGSGKKAHGYDRSIGGNTVIDEFTLPGEFPYPSFEAVPLTSTSIATANDHVLQLMAGSSNNVRIRYMRFEQSTNATTAAVGIVEIWRLSSAGTGGTSVTPAKYDTADGAAGATAMTLPSAKGTESVLLKRFAMVYRQAVAVAQAQVDDAWERYQKPGQKPIIIPAGTSNGIAIKGVTAVAAATVIASIEFVETAFV